MSFNHLWVVEFSLGPGKKWRSNFWGFRTRKEADNVIALKKKMNPGALHRRRKFVAKETK